MKLKLVLLIIILSLPAIAAPQKKAYIGYKHKGVKYGEVLSNGAKDLGGGLLSNENYGVTRFSIGKQYMLWLEKVTGRDSKGVPNWEVKDVLSFDGLKKNQEFTFSYSSGCIQNGKGDLDLIVLTEYLPATKTYKAVQAWRANTARGKFEKTSTKKIECQNVTSEKYE